MIEASLGALYSEILVICASYDEKMAAETLLTKMNLKNYQVRTFISHNGYYPNILMRVWLYHCHFAMS